MAKSKSTSGTSEKGRVLEATLMLNPRGRSVVHGTLLLTGEMKTFKHDLTATEISIVEELILNEFLITPNP